MYYDYDKNKYIYDHTAEEYEQLICESPLFTLNKESETSAYKREAEKMVKYLYEYIVTKDHDQIEYALEIVMVAGKTIKNYDSSQGNFLHYFNSWWSNEKKSIAHEQVKDSYIGQTLSKEDTLGISKYKKAVEKLSRNYPLYMYSSTTKEYDQLIADEMNASLKKVEYFRTLIANAPTSDIGENDKGEQVSTIELAQGKGLTNDLREKEYRPEDIMMKPFKYSEYYDAMEKVYLSKQLRLQCILKVIITSEFFQTIVSDEDLARQFKKYSFCDSETVRYCIRKHREMTHREIAEKFGRDEASISRTWKDFRTESCIVLENIRKGI